MTNTAELKARAMKLLADELGIVEAEHFISLVSREKFDYTTWQREFYDVMKPGEFAEKAYLYSVSHPYGGSAKKLVL